MSVDSERTSSVPHPARSKCIPVLGAETDWPSTIRFVISELETSPLPPVPFATMLIEPAVISPPKIDRSSIFTTPEAVPALASPSTDVVTDPPDATDPSAG